MKKKIMMLLVTAVAFTGCSMPQVEKGKTKKEIEAEEAYQVTMDAKEKKVEGSYEKVAIEKQKLNAEEITELLVGQPPENVKEKEEEDGLTEYTMNIDHVKHSWSGTETSYYYNNNKKNGVNDTIEQEEAQKIADQFIEKLAQKYQITYAEPQIVAADQTQYDLVYIQQYKGTNFLGMQNLSLEGSGDDDAPVSGSYIYITVGKSGITAVDIDSIYQFHDTLETYSDASKYLTEEKLAELVKDYYKEFADLGSEGTRIKKIEVIYLPYPEREKEVLLPVYQLTVVDEGEDCPMYMWIDLTQEKIYGDGC